MSRDVRQFVRRQIVREAREARAGHSGERARLRTYIYAIRRGYRQVVRGKKKAAA